MTSLVSIIIPVFNRERLVQKTLNSIILQSYTHWECIVVDDHSTDNTVEIISDYTEKDSRIKLYKRPSRLKKGANSCRNYGYQLSKGTYINWFDSDDIMYPDFIASKVLCFEKNNSLLAVYSKHDLLYEETKKKVEIEIFDSNNITKDYIMYKLKLLTPSLMFKSTFLKDKHLFDVSITRGQETDFFSRILPLINNNQFGFVNKSLFLYFINSTSKSSQKYNASHTQSRALIFERIILKFCYDKDIKHKYITNFHYLMYKAYVNNDIETFEIISKKLRNLLPNLSYSIFHCSFKYSIKALGRFNDKAMLWLWKKDFRNSKIRSV